MKNHWITNCPHFKEGDKTAELKQNVDCEICLDKLYDALQDGLVENRIQSQADVGWDGTTHYSEEFEDSEDD